MNWKEKALVSADAILTEFPVVLTQSERDLLRLLLCKAFQQGVGHALGDAHRKETKTDPEILLP